MAKAYLAKRLAPSAIAITFASAAYAQTQLVPVTYPDLPQLAPAQAIGAVVWLHGRSLDTEDSQAPTPPYIGILRRAGWAPYRFNRLTADDLLSNSTERLVDQIDQLKRQGYRRIALAGQSFGGFIALGAAAETPKVDAVIATAPAAFGDFSDSFDTWRLNATRLYPLLERISRSKVMLFFFHGDDFDPGGRGERADQILGRRPIPYAIIDQPRSLIQHWAAGSRLFAERCGQFIADFLNGTRNDETALLQCRDDNPPVETPSRPTGTASSFLTPPPRR